MTQAMMHRNRGFRLLVRREAVDAYGLHLEETNGSPMTPSIPVSQVDWRVARRVLPSVVDAVSASGLPRSTVGPQRRAPIKLEEAAGVRLALVLLVTAPLVRLDRAEAMAAAVAGMSDEEAYYWYSKCMGTKSGRARRALRLLLAEDDR